MKIVILSEVWRAVVRQTQSKDLRFSPAPAGLPSASPPACDNPLMHHPNIRNIAVFCASAPGTNPLFRTAAGELGRALAERGLGLIYGGAALGLMGAVADAALAAGGRVVGVMPQFFLDGAEPNSEVAHSTLTELHLTPDMHARKALMAERADAFLVLPGGFGTLEELFEIVTWQVLKLHAKPIVLINVAGFYDPLLAFLDHCVTEGVIKAAKRPILKSAESVEAALRLLDL